MEVVKLLPNAPQWMVYKGQRDPAAILQTGNLFVFCGNNPIMFIDPSGLEFIIAWSYSDSDIIVFNNWLYNNGHTDTLMEGTDNWTDDHWAEFESRDAFSRAAQTRWNALIAMGVPEDEIRLHRIDSREHLAELWAEWESMPIVEGLEFFMHGTDVRRGSGDFWDNASVLNWQVTLRGVTPFAAFHGCKTTYGGFTQNFANRQGVRTYGNYYSSNFSHNANWRTLPHHRINPHGTTLGVYLRVYGGNRNWGRAHDMIRFLPQ